MTNGDKIRNMTDRELANFLTLDDSKPCIHCMRGGHAWCETDETFVCTTDYVTDVFTAWLASEAVSGRSEKEGEIT